MVPLALSRPAQRSGRRVQVQGREGEEVVDEARRPRAEVGVSGGDAPRVRPYVGKAVIVTPGQAAGALADPDDPESAPPPDHPVLRSDLAAHVPYRSPRPLVRVRLDT